MTQDEFPKTTELPHNYPTGTERAKLMCTNMISLLFDLFILHSGMHEVCADLAMKRAQLSSPLQVAHPTHAPLPYF